MVQVAIVQMAKRLGGKLSKGRIDQRAKHPGAELAEW